MAEPRPSLDDAQSTGDHIAEARPTSSGAADLTVSPAAVTFSQKREAEWNPQRARHERQVAKETAGERQAEFERLQVAEDNKQRRQFQQHMFYLVEAVVALATGLTVVIIAFADNSDTKEKAWSMLTLMVGGVIGGTVGYMTGKSGK